MTSFSTLQYSKELQAVGFSQSQAEVIAEGVGMNLNATHNFASKTDLKDLRYGMKCLEHRLTNKVGAIVVGTASVVILLDKYL
jgi:hypothetical protein